MLKKIVKKSGENSRNDFTTGSFSIKGRKPTQEDDFYISESRGKHKLVIVADGVGGHGHGDFASKTTVKTFAEAFTSADNFKDIPHFLEQTTRQTAQKVLDKALEDESFKNCGSTVTGFFIVGDKFFTLNVGDSRVYLFSKKELKQLTKDHSLVQRMVDNGEITPQEALNHPKRNIMTSAIGQPVKLIKIDVEGSFSLESGDMLLAFSDGVHDYLSHSELTELISTNFENPDLAKILVNTAYVNGSKDNITACFLKY